MGRFPTTRVTWLTFQFSAGNRVHVKGYQLKQSMRVNGDWRDVKQSAKLFQHLHSASLEWFHSVGWRVNLGKESRWKLVDLPNSSDELALDMQKWYHKTFIQLRRIHCLKLLVVAAFNASGNRRVKWSCQVNTATPFRMNPRFFP